MKTGISRPKRCDLSLPAAVQVIGTIIGAIVVGLVVGGLARLIMPGKQNVGVVMTVILGALGASLESGCPNKMAYSNQNGGFKIIPFLVGIVFRAHPHRRLPGRHRASHDQSTVARQCGDPHGWCLAASAPLATKPPTATIGIAIATWRNRLASMGNRVGRGDAMTLAAPSGW